MSARPFPGADPESWPIKAYLSPVSGRVGLWSVEPGTFEEEGEEAAPRPYLRQDIAEASTVAAVEIALEVIKQTVVVELTRRIAELQAQLKQQGGG